MPCQTPHVGTDNHLPITPVDWDSLIAELQAIATDSLGNSASVPKDLLARATRTAEGVSSAIDSIANLQFVLVEPSDVVNLTYVMRARLAARAGLAPPPIQAKLPVAHRSGRKFGNFIDDIGGISGCFERFGYGYALMTDESLRLAVDRMRAVALAIAVILSVGYCLVDVNGYLSGWHVQRFSALDIGLYLARITAGWCWIVALVAYGRRYMTASGPVLGYLREASYPVYILHQTVIILVAYIVVSWDAGVAVKFLAILIAATAGTMLVYELLVRRFDPIRFLFGMKPRSRVARPALRTAS